MRTKIEAVFWENLLQQVTYERSHYPCEQHFYMADLTLEVVVCQQFFCRIELIKYSELKRCPFGSISTILNPSGDQKTVSIRFSVEIIVFGFVDGFSLVCSHCCSKSLLK